MLNSFGIGPLAAKLATAAADTADARATRTQHHHISYAQASSTAAMVFGYPGMMGASLAASHRSNAVAFDRPPPRRRLPQRAYVNVNEYIAALPLMDTILS